MANRTERIKTIIGEAVKEAIKIPVDKATKMNPDVISKIAKNSDVFIDENQPGEETKQSSLPVLDEIVELDATNLEDWEAVHALFGTEVETTDIKSIDSKAKAIAKVSDYFGWDFVYQLSDGRVAFPDRNSGFTNITKQKADGKQIVKQIKSILAQGNENEVDETLSLEKKEEEAKHNAFGETEDECSMMENILTLKKQLSK